MEAILDPAPAQVSISLPVIPEDARDAPVQEEVYISSGGRHFQLPYSTFLRLRFQPDILPEIRARAKEAGVALLTFGSDCRSCAHYDPKRITSDRRRLPSIEGQPGIAVNGCSYTPREGLSQTRPYLEVGEDGNGKFFTRTVNLRTCCAHADIQAEVLLLSGRLVDFETYHTKSHLPARTYLGFDKKPSLLQKIARIIP